MYDLLQNYNVWFAKQELNVWFTTIYNFLQKKWNVWELIELRIKYMINIRIKMCYN